MSSFKNFDVLSITECHQFFTGHQGKGYSVMGRNISWIIIFLGIWWQLTKNGYCLINEEKRTWKSNHKAKSLVIALIFNMFSSTTLLPIFICAMKEGKDGFSKPFDSVGELGVVCLVFWLILRQKPVLSQKKETLEWQKTFFEVYKKRINVNWDPHYLLITAYSYYGFATS